MAVLEVLQGITFTADAGVCWRPWTGSVHFQCSAWVCSCGSVAHYIVATHYTSTHTSVFFSLVSLFSLFLTTNSHAHWQVHHRRHPHKFAHKGVSQHSLQPQAGKSQEVHFGWGDCYPWRYLNQPGQGTIFPSTTLLLLCWHDHLQALLFMLLPATLHGNALFLSSCPSCATDC